MPVRQMSAAIREKLEFRCTEAVPLPHVRLWRSLGGRAVRQSFSHLFSIQAPQRAAGDHARPARSKITNSNWFAPCLAARGTGLTLTVGIPRARGEAHELT